MAGLVCRAAEVIASGQVAGWEALHEIESYADQRSVVVLLAASDLILTSVEIRPALLVSLKICCRIC